MDSSHLIATTDQLQGFTRINISVLKESFLPYERDARYQYIIPYLGETLSEELYTLASQQTYPEWADELQQRQMLDKVLLLTRNALAKFTLYLAAPHLDVHLSGMGFVVTSTDGQAPASGERVKRVIMAYLNQGYDSLEVLLAYLEKHHESIPSYKDCEAFVVASGRFIRYAREFHSIVPIDMSRRRFIQLMGDMDNIEKLVIEPVISTELAERLRQGGLKKDLTPRYEMLLDYVKRSIVLLSASQNIEMIYGQHPQKEGQPSQEAMARAKDRYHGHGQNYLGKIRRLLDKFPEEFPEYRNSAQYIQKRDYTPWRNPDDDDNKIFVFGQPSL